MPDKKEPEQILAVIQPLIGLHMRKKRDVVRIANQNNVSVSSVYRWLNLYEAEGVQSLIRKKRKDNNVNRLTIIEEQLIEIAILNAIFQSDKVSSSTQYYAKTIFLLAGITPPHKNTIRNRLNAYSQRLDMPFQFDGTDLNASDLSIQAVSRYAVVKSYLACKNNSGFSKASFCKANNVNENQLLEYLGSYDPSLELLSLFCEGDSFLTDLSIPAPSSLNVEFVDHISEIISYSRQSKRELNFSGLLESVNDIAEVQTLAPVNAPLKLSVWVAAKTVINENYADNADITLGAKKRSTIWGRIGKTGERFVSLDLDQPQTISVFGVQGAGKSYTIGSLVEMVTQSINNINKIHQPAQASVIFHYSQSEFTAPELTSLPCKNNNQADIKCLNDIYGAAPKGQGNVVLLVPPDKLEQRQREYPSLEVVPLYFNSKELSASHWKLLMSAVGNGSTYIKQISHILKLNRQNLCVAGIKSAISDSPLNKHQKDLAMMRLEFAQSYIKDDVTPITQILEPGRVVIVDLRDQFIEKEEALGMFQCLLQLFSDYSGCSKSIVFDEIHRYCDDSALVKMLIEAVREMRHKATSIIISSQDPLSVPLPIIELSTQIILHKMNSPEWLRHLQKACIGLKNLSAKSVHELNSGEAFIWSSKSSEPAFEKGAVKVTCRPRITLHGGSSITSTHLHNATPEA